MSALVAEAHRRFRGTADGTCSPVYPALAAADPARYGLCFVATRGVAHAAGDSTIRFVTMSVAKPFVLGLVCEAIGSDRVRQLIGVNATAEPFDSIAAVQRAAGGHTNPMVNAGAIATLGLVPGRSLDEKWAFVLDGLSRFFGRRLEIDDEVFASTAASNHRNRALGELLHEIGALQSDPGEAIELYTRQSCLSIDVVDLAAAGATIANGGVQPVTRDVIIGAEACRSVLAAMVTAGMYERSGDWLWEVGLPAKSAISGAIVTVAPGTGALGVYSPPLDETGNSVRGRLAATFVAEALGLTLFADRPGT